ncbi:threonine aldolase family protein [Paludibacterium yongneupense]|uniref:threonine aldolase family protein n=1 Tax=Paludibacterium yongneupense TaxID=400061 RepID=UPI00048BB49E|nr:beta-eliminating lyase-related protein [Paludibacterium yongneupense]
MTVSDSDRLRQGCSLILHGFHVPTPAAEFRAMADWCEAHAVEHDLYGDGDLLSGFEARVASVLGKPAAVFMPSGTMAQLIAMRIWSEAQGVERIGLHPTSHLLLHEEQAYQALFGLHAVALGDRLRPLRADDLAALRQPLACLQVELPLREAGGQLPEWDALLALQDAARARGLPLHMDGARLWECRAFYGRSHAEIAHGFASVYVSVYKGLGGIAGAVLAGDQAFIAQARVWQRRMGGVLVRQSPMVVSAAMRFDERLGLMDACYRRTLSLAQGLASIPGVRVNPARPQVNMLHLYFDAPAERVRRARDRLAEAEGCWLLGGVREADVPGWSVSELYVGDTLLGLDDAQVLPWYVRLLELARKQEGE